MPLARPRCTSRASRKFAAIDFALFGTLLGRQGECIVTPMRACFARMAGHRPARRPDAALLRHSGLGTMPRFGVRRRAGSPRAAERPMPAGAAEKRHGPAFASPRFHIHSMTPSALVFHAQRMPDGRRCRRSASRMARGIFAASQGDAPSTTMGRWA